LKQVTPRAEARGKFNVKDDSTINTNDMFSASGVDAAGTAHIVVEIVNNDLDVNNPLLHQGVDQH
jgi:hypothetical protein